jgi:hypothetical protein
MCTLARAPVGRASLIDHPTPANGTPRATPSRRVAKSSITHRRAETAEACCQFGWLGNSQTNSTAMGPGALCRHGLSINLSSLAEIGGRAVSPPCSPNCTVTVQMDQERTRPSEAGPLPHETTRGASYMSRLAIVTTTSLAISPDRLDGGWHFENLAPVARDR